MPVIAEAEQVQKIDVIAVDLRRYPDWTQWKSVPGEVGVEAGQGRGVRGVDRHREQAHHRADAVGLAQVERVTGRVGQRDPGRPVGQPGRAQADRPSGRRLGIVDLQVQVELLRVLLPRPPRRDVVRCALEFDLLAVRSPDAEPVGISADDVPAGEFGVERTDLLDVRRVEDGQVQASCHGHGHILPHPSDKRGRLAAGQSVGGSMGAEAVAGIDGPGAMQISRGAMRRRALADTSPRRTRSSARW